MRTAHGRRIVHMWVGDSPSYTMEPSDVTALEKLVTVVWSEMVGRI